MPLQIIQTSFTHLESKRGEAQACHSLISGLDSEPSLSVPQVIAVKSIHFTLHGKGWPGFWREKMLRAAILPLPLTLGSFETAEPMDGVRLFC